jgi:S1-C subfamily serine protease
MARLRPQSIATRSLQGRLPGRNREVLDFLPDSPALRADIRKGDLVIQANGADLPSVDALLSSLAQDSAFREVDITLVRKGQKITARLAPTVP